MLAHLQGDQIGPEAQAAVDHVNRLTYSPAEAGEVLGCSRRTVYELIRRGELRAYKVGRLTKLRVSEVHALVGEGVA